MKVNAILTACLAGVAIAAPTGHHSYDDHHGHNGHDGILGRSHDGTHDGAHAAFAGLADHGGAAAAGHDGLNGVFGKRAAGQNKDLLTRMIQERMAEEQNSKRQLDPVSSFWDDAGVSRKAKRQLDAATGLLDNVALGNKAKRDLASDAPTQQKKQLLTRMIEEHMKRHHDDHDDHFGYNIASGTPHHGNSVAFHQGDHGDHHDDGHPEQAAQNPAGDLAGGLLGGGLLGKRDGSSGGILGDIRKRQLEAVTGLLGGGVLGKRDGSSGGILGDIRKRQLEVVTGLVGGALPIGKRQIGGNISNGQGKASE